jgi:hypothetical protein
MRRTRGDTPGERELERKAARARRKPVPGGAYTGHEGGTGATAQASKRYKRSL